MNDGGPAFPMLRKWISEPANSSVQTYYGATESSGGMSLRDWFAGMALQGELASASTHKSAAATAQAALNAGFRPDEVEKFIALSVYRIADAMISERNKLTNSQ